MSLDDLYQEIILDHYRRPRNKAPLTGLPILVHHNNPLCGDEIDLGVAINNGVVSRLVFQGHGCAISQASASMMSEAVLNLTTPAALDLIETVRQMMHGASPDQDLGELMALEGVAKFSVRIKCALLPWMALQDALHTITEAAEAGDNQTGAP